MGRPNQYGTLADMLLGIGPNPSAPSNANSLSWLSRAVQPLPPPKPDGIWFARTNGPNVRFSEPFSFPVNMYGLLGLIGAQRDPGLYAIVVADSAAYPRPFRVLYFGESENMNDRVTDTHERYSDWCRAAGGADKLRVCYHWMFGSSKEERTALESGLIGYYGPECNRQFNPLAGLFGSGGMR